ncbi:NUDIX domain-containing protein [candidate division WOR-3 bacterium]|nr:NUDIX domain-containing protein [candidate division WOR-3 bacterium]
MARAPFQVLIFPYIKDKQGLIEYAIFRRSDGNYWQAIAGGGEEGETPEEAAKREIQEEAGIPKDCDITALDSKAYIPVIGVTGEYTWGDDVFVIPEYTFGAEVENRQLKLSKEHRKYQWVNYEEAMKMLKWDSNKNALWELNERLIRKN